MTVMLTLGQIDAMFPETHDGSVFSDLHKDVYGYRPRGVEFASLEDFDVEFKRLSRQLSIQLDMERRREVEARMEFEASIAQMRKVFPRATMRDIIRYMAEGEGISKADLKFYGYEALEYAYGLKFGTINEMLKGR